MCDCIYLLYQGFRNKGTSIAPRYNTGAGEHAEALLQVWGAQAETYKRSLQMEQGGTDLDITHSVSQSDIVNMVLNYQNQILKFKFYKNIKIWITLKFITIILWNFYFFS